MSFHIWSPHLPGLRVGVGDEVDGQGAGPRSIILGSTGCMYVANTTYYSTSWSSLDAHAARQQRLGGAGTAMGLKALMRKGKMKREAINVIAFCGDGVERTWVLPRSPRPSRIPTIISSF